MCTVDFYKVPASRARCACAKGELVDFLFNKREQCGSTSPLKYSRPRQLQHRARCQVPLESFAFLFHSFISLGVRVRVRVMGMVMVMVRARAR